VLSLEQKALLHLPFVSSAQYQIWAGTDSGTAMRPMAIKGECSALASLLQPYTLKWYRMMLQNVGKIE
jgi:hypothetical protein